VSVQERPTQTTPPPVSVEAYRGVEELCDELLRVIAERLASGEYSAGAVDYIHGWMSSAWIDAQIEVMP